MAQGRNISQQIFSLFRMQKITCLDSITTMGPGDTCIYMFSSSYCSSTALKASQIPSLLTPEMECQTYFYTLLPFRFILLSSFSVSHSICNLYSKCLLRQYIPLAQLCVLKFLGERLLLLLLSVNKIFKWPPGSCFSCYIIFYSLGYISQLAAQLAATKAQ